MKRARDAIRYDLDCYDRHACLRPSVVLIVALIFACREYLLPLVVLVGSLKGRSQYDISFLLEQHHTLALMLELPAVAVVFALIRRAPSGGDLARWIWKRGRMLLSLALLLDVWLAVSFSDLSLRHIRSMTEDTIGLMIRLSLDAAILGYLNLSARAKDAFSEFPSRALSSAS